MTSGIPLRDDFDGFALRALAKGTMVAPQARRLLALAEIYDGHSRSDAARIGGVTLQIVRDWVIRFNARGPSGLINGKAPGNQGKLSDVHRQALAKIVESGPIPAVHGVVRWRRKDHNRHWLIPFPLLGPSIIRYLGEGAGHSINFPATPAAIKSRLPKNVEIELWWADEARIGQKNKITRRWARKGTRPLAPHDQRTMWTYIFGAISPKKGKGAGLVLPYTATPVP
jgi:hypothetical protein